MTQQSLNWNQHKLIETLANVWEMYPEQRQGFLSPIVVQRFCEYMEKNRIQTDGNVRDSDNWQKLFGEHHTDVCLKSAWRHFLDIWLHHRGFKGRDTLEDSICACLFNLQAYLYALLIKK